MCFVSGGLDLTGDPSLPRLQKLVQLFEMGFVGELEEVVESSVGVVHPVTRVEHWAQLWPNESLSSVGP